MPALGVGLSYPVTELSPTLQRISTSSSACITAAVVRPV